MALAVKDRYQPKELASLSAEIKEAEQASGEHEERLRSLFFAMTVAEKLDELEEALDRTGPPARHAALVHQRIMRLKKQAES